MGEWINPAPLELERYEREVNGVIESALTPEAEIQHRHNLDKAKQQRVQVYLAEAAENLAIIESGQLGVAAD